MSEPTIPDNAVALVMEGSFVRWETFETPEAAALYARGVGDGAQCYGAGDAWAVIWADEADELKKVHDKAYEDAINALRENPKDPKPEV